MTSPQPKPRGPGRTLARIFTWLVAIVVVLIAALAVFIYTFDWNRAKPYVNEKVTEAIGRPFAIVGDLKVGWRRPPGETGWRAWVPWPRFSAAQIEVANPDWTKSPHFATLDEIDFEVAVLPLLAHDIVIPAINLVNPSVDIERLADGRNNWTFKLPASSGPSTWKLNLHDITFGSGNIAVDDKQTKTDVKMVVSLPGMMTGQVLAGQSPLQAVRYQIVIMFLIAASSALGTVGSVLLAYRRLFSPEHRFLAAKLIARDARAKGAKARV